MSSPTPKMIEFATNLLKELGYDPDEYNLENMSFNQVSELIEELADEQGLEL